MLIALFSIIFAIGITGSALVLTGLISVISSIAILIQHVPTAIFMLGAGLLCVGLGVLIIQGTIIFTKSSFSGVVHIISRFVLRRSGE